MLVSADWRMTSASGRSRSIRSHLCRGPLEIFLHELQHRRGVGDRYGIQSAAAEAVLPWSGETIFVTEIGRAIASCSPLKNDGSPLIITLRRG